MFRVAGLIGLHIDIRSDAMNFRHDVNARYARGFSMIDVLIAIVVMATALLALAVLQGTLTRNTADARARSQIAMYGDGLLEQSRQSGYSGIANNTRTAATGTNFDSAAKAAQVAAGVSSLVATTTVTSYTYADSNVPGATADCTGAFVTSLKTCPQSLNPVQYKNVGVALTWTDATGGTRSISENTIVSPLALDTSQTLVQRDFGTGGGRTPSLLPSAPVSPGVIALATAKCSHTATTQPKAEPPRRAHARRHHPRPPKRSTR